MPAVLRGFLSRAAAIPRKTAYTPLSQQRIHHSPDGIKLPTHLSVGRDRAVRAASRATLDAREPQEHTIFKVANSAPMTDVARGTRAAVGSAPPVVRFGPPGYDRRNVRQSCPAGMASTLMWRAEAARIDTVSQLTSASRAPKMSIETATLAMP